MGAFFIVAEFEQVDNSNDDEIVFALPMSNNDCSIFPITASYDGYDTFRQQVITNLSSTQIFKNHQAEYTAIEGSDSEWWKSSNLSEFFYVFESNNTETYVALYQLAGDSCGSEYFLPAFSISKFIDEEFMENLYLIDDAFNLVMAFDYNNDGNLEYIIEDFFGKRILIVWNGTDLENKFGWSIPFLDCPC